MSSCNYEYKVSITGQQFHLTKESASFALAQLSFTSRSPLSHVVDIHECDGLTIQTTNKDGLVSGSSFTSVGGAVFELGERRFP